MRLFIIMFVASGSFLLSPAYADEEMKAEKVLPDNPYIETIHRHAKALQEGLSEDQLNDLALLRQNFGMFQSVSLIRSHVQKAVEDCINENPDLGNTMETSFENWKGRVTPKLEEQKNRLREEITEERFGKTAEIKKYFKAIDKAAEYADDHLYKESLTSEEACKKLEKSMQKTSDEIVALLDKVEWPAPITATKETEAQQ